MVGRKCLILDVYDTQEKVLIKEDISSNEVMELLGINKSHFENKYYNDKLIHKRYQLIYKSGGNHATVEERKKNKISDDREYYLKFKHAWDQARLALNPMARRY